MHNVPEAQPEPPAPDADLEKPRLPPEVPPESQPRSPTAPAVPSQPPLVPTPPVVERKRTNA